MLVGSCGLQGCGNTEQRVRMVLSSTVQSCHFENSYLSGFQKNADIYKLNWQPVYVVIEAGIGDKIPEHFSYNIYGQQFVWTRNGAPAEEGELYFQNEKLHHHDWDIATWVRYLNWRWSCKEVPNKTRATYLRQCTSINPVLWVRSVVDQTSRMLSMPSSLLSGVNVVVDLIQLSCWKMWCQVAVTRIELSMDSSYSADAGVMSHGIIKWHGVVKHHVKQWCHEAPHQQQEIIF